MTRDWHFDQDEIQRLFFVESKLVDRWQHGDDAASKTSAKRPSIASRCKEPSLYSTTPSFSTYEDNSFDNVLPDTIEEVQQIAFSFYLTEDGDGLVGESLETNVQLWMRKTQKYAVICIADKPCNNARCREEVAWIAQHIVSQGY